MVSSPLLLRLTACVLALATPLLAARRERSADTWRPSHYDVSITLNNQLTEITRADTKIELVALKDSLEVINLDFGQMHVSCVSISGPPVRYEQKPGTLTVFLSHPARKGEKLTLDVSYDGNPKDGLILTNDRDGKPSATGDNWPDRVHNWIPCIDHPSAKATVTFTVTAAKNELVVANGLFEGVTVNSDGTSTWKFNESQPIPPYCMVIAVNQGVKLDSEGLLLAPLSYYVPHIDRAYAMQGFSSARPALAFLSQTIAPYPYEKLALIVGATRFGGMENSSAIVFTSSLFDLRKDEQMSRRFGIPTRIEDVVAHEIAHQWFGDSVTESTWSDLWLSEGFATYFAGLFIQRYEGEDTFREYMQRAAQTYFQYEKESRTPIFDTSTEDLFKLLNANNYQKGAWVLHMLRLRLGDDAFFRGIRVYYNAHKDSTASSEDLRNALEGASGLNLKEFFARWVYGTGHPQYEASWKWLAGGVIKISLRQLQPEPAFPNHLPIEITTAKGRQRLLLRPTGKETVEEFHLDGPPSSVYIDPDQTILKELTVRPMK